MDSDAAQLRPVRQIFSKNGNKNGSASRFARGRQQQAIPIRHAFGRAASASAARTALNRLPVSGNDELGTGLDFAYATGKSLVCFT
jgi:hypothetical protein